MADPTAKLKRYSSFQPPHRQLGAPVGQDPLRLVQEQVPADRHHRDLGQDQGRPPVPAHRPDIPRLWRCTAGPDRFVRLHWPRSPRDTAPHHQGAHDQGARSCKTDFLVFFLKPNLDDHRSSRPPRPWSTTRLSTPSRT